MIIKGITMGIGELMEVILQPKVLIPIAMLLVGAYILRKLGFIK